MAALITQISGEDDEEFDQAVNVELFTSDQTSIEENKKLLEAALQKYQRDGFFEKYFMRELGANGEFTKIGSGAFGDVFKARYKEIRPFNGPSEWFAIKRMEIRPETFHGVITEFKFFSIYPELAPCLCPSEYWYEKKDPSKDVYYLYLLMNLCAENMRHAMHLLRKTYGDGERVASQPLAIFNLLIFDDLLDIFSKLQRFENPIMHRDFKPENVLFTEEGIKLCDFGCATAGHVRLDSHLGSVNQPTHELHTLGIGTDLYQPPEQKRYHPQASKGSYDYKVDMYALGLTLLELFYATSIPELRGLFEAVKLRHEIPPELSRRWPQIAKIILNLTEKEPEKRKSAKDTRDDLHALWNDFIDDHIDVRNMRMNIEGASEVLKQTVNDYWVNTISMMNETEWSFFDEKGSVSKLFSIKNGLPRTNKCSLKIQCTNFGIASVAYATLKEIKQTERIEERRVSNEEKASLLKKKFESKFPNQNYYCFISPTTIVKSEVGDRFLMGKDMNMYDGTLVESVAFQNSAIYVYIGKRKKVSIARDLFDNVHATIVEDKALWISAIDYWLRCYLKEVPKGGERRNYYHNFTENLRKPIVNTLSKHWTVSAGKFTDTIISNMSTVRKSEITSGNERVIVFREASRDKQVVRHSLVAALHYYAGFLFNFNRLAEHMESNPPFSLTQLKKSFKSADRYNVMYTKGYFSFVNPNASVVCDVYSFAFEHRMIIWGMSNNYEYSPVDVDGVISIVRKEFMDLKDILPRIPVDDINGLQIALRINKSLRKKYNTVWGCLVGNANHLQHIVYHNGNYFNLVFGELEMVIYQPGLICSADRDTTGIDQASAVTIMETTCSFTIFERKILQKLYHCTTCQLIDEKGICEVCAATCHKGHTTMFSRFYSFSCDCKKHV